MDLNSNPALRTAKETLMYRSVLWNLWERERVGRFGRMADAPYWMLGAGVLGRPRGRVWGGRREEGSGWGTQVYLWRFISIFGKTNTIL